MCIRHTHAVIGNLLVVLLQIVLLIPLRTTHNSRLDVGELGIQKYCDIRDLIIVQTSCESPHLSAGLFLFASGF